jgi:hypothetical protein
MPPHMQSVEFELLQSKRIAAMNLRKEMIKTEGRKSLPDALQFVGISRCN